MMRRPQQSHRHRRRIRNIPPAIFLPPLLMHVATLLLFPPRGAPCGPPLLLVMAGGAFVPVVPRRNRGGRSCVVTGSAPDPPGREGFDAYRRRRKRHGTRMIPSFASAPGDAGGNGGATRRRGEGGAPDGMVGRPATPATTKKKNDDTRSRKAGASPTARSVAVDALAEGGGGGGGKKKKKKKGASQPFAVRRLEADPSYAALADRRDRSFARLLVATVERRMGQIDMVLGRVASVYPPKRGRHASRVQACLRVGAAQLLFLDTPHHAAIKETVDVLKMPPSPASASGGGPKVPEPMIKFVNAVLRSISRTGAGESLRGTSAGDNVAPWLVRELTETYGEEIAGTIIEEMANGEPPPLDISAKCNLGLSGRERVEALEGLRRDLSGGGGDDRYNDDDGGGDGDDLAAVVLPHGTIRLGRRGGKGAAAIGAVDELPRFDEWWVQDASAAVPALALRGAVLARVAREAEVEAEGSAVGGGAGERGGAPSSPLSRMHVVDMCAAPGGKTAQLLSAGFGRVTAVESNARRCRRLGENMRRLGFLPQEPPPEPDEPGGRRGCGDLSIVVSEGQSWLPPADDGVDAVLLDAPCSATGTGRRRPDVLRRDEGSLEDLVRTQGGLLVHCADDVLAPGGILVYATCSLLRREGEDQVEGVLRRGAGGGADGGGATLETVPFVPGEIPGFDDAIDPRGWLRVLPGTLKGDMRSCDGFFVAKLIKVA